MLRVNSRETSCSICFGGKLLLLEGVDKMVYMNEKQRDRGVRLPYSFRQNQRAHSVGYVPGDQRTVMPMARGLVATPSE